MDIREFHHRPLPQWVALIHDEIAHTICVDRALIKCRVGDRTALERTLVAAWPFIDAIPRVYEEVRQNIREDVAVDHVRLNTRYGPGTIGLLDELSRETLRDTPGEERSHCRQWQRACASLGVAPERFAEGALPSPACRIAVERLLRYGSPVQTMVYIATVELTAQAVANSMLDSVLFKHALAGEGLNWFYTHSGEASTRHAQEAFRWARTCSLLFRDAPELMPNEVRRYALEMLDDILGIAREAVPTERVRV